METLPFKEIWAVDFEFHTGGVEGNQQIPVCVVGKELKSGRCVRVWYDDFTDIPPYPTHKNCLVIAYFASAEAHCHLSLGWPLPENLIDCYAEFRVLTNGVEPMWGRGLIGALKHFGIYLNSGRRKRGDA